MNKKKAFFAIGVFWLILMGGFIGMMEYTLHTGTTVLLQTRPVDPRDLLRGDYVVLDFDISSVDRELIIQNEESVGKGRTVYVYLRVDAGGVASVKSVEYDAHEDRLFLKGEVLSVSEESIEIGYGIESYFVPEGRGREIERSLDEMQAKVTIDSGGRAVLRGLVKDGVDFLPKQ